MALSGDLPAYARIGRASIPGPTTGGMTCIPFNFNDVAATFGANIFCAMQLPFAFRVEGFTWWSNSNTAVVADVDIMIHQNDTADLTTPTNLLTAVVAVDAANEGWLSADGGSVAQRLTTTTANRTIAAGQFLVFEVDGDGADSAWSGGCHVWGFPMTHIQSDAAND